MKNSILLEIIFGGARNDTVTILQETLSATLIRFGGASNDTTRNFVSHTH